MEARVTLTSLAKACLAAKPAGVTVATKLRVCGADLGRRALALSPALPAAHARPCSHGGCATQLGAAFAALDDPTGARSCPNSLIIPDKHAGLIAAARKVLPEATVTSGEQHLRACRRE